MKRKLLLTVSFTLAALLAFALWAGAVTLGDVDGDGARNSADARLALRASVKLEDVRPGTAQFTAADADGNGAIEASDARTILRASVKLDPLPEDPAEVLAAKDYTDPVTGWSDYDALIRRIKAETDAEKRAALMHEAEDMLMANYCVLPLYYYNDIYLQKSGVTGIYANPYGTKFFMNTVKADGDKTLRLCLATEPDTLDPALTSTVDGACLAANSFAGLYTYDAEGHTAPACAKGYTVSDDGLTVTVTLKDGLKWSDGSPLTAADFAYSWKRAIDPATAADYEYMFSGFDGYREGALNVTAVNDTTLRFVLTAPCLYIEDLMAFPTFYPVKQSAVESAGATGRADAWCAEAGFVSNGPFVCAGWDHEASMTYVRNPYYYDADKVTVDRLEFLLSADEEEIYAFYQAGRLDFTDEVPTELVAQMLGDGNEELHIVDELGTYYIAFNAQSDLFDGMTPAGAACLREAVSLLIDRQYICDVIGQTGQMAANSFIPLGMADGNGGLFHPDLFGGYYDPYGINANREGTLARARQLLWAAGFSFNDDGTLSDKTPLAFTYLTNDSSGHIVIANAIREDLAVLGIEMNVRSEDWYTFLQDRKEGNFTLAREGWIADFNDPVNMLEMFTSDSGNNDCRFGDKTAGEQGSSEEPVEIWLSLGTDEIVLAPGGTDIIPIETDAPVDISLRAETDLDHIRFAWSDWFDTDRGTSMIFLSVSAESAPEDGFVTVSVNEFPETSETLSLRASQSSDGSYPFIDCPDFGVYTGAPASELAISMEAEQIWLWYYAEDLAAAGFETDQAVADYYGDVLQKNGFDFLGTDGEQDEDGNSFVYYDYRNDAADISVTLICFYWNGEIDSFGVLIQ